MKTTYRSRHLFARLVTVALGICLLPFDAVMAQSDADADASDEPIDNIIVVGTLRDTLQKSLDVKRNNTVISDALVGVEIGDLPDLSVAESLERITGVTSDRFKGGASELSVRGLGAFLGASVMNGREISSGSDGRDVNFGQFPSELIGGSIVYKSQQASFVEGGISGIIELRTQRPLEASGRKLRVKALVGHSEYEDRVDDGDPISERVTALYTDQFDLTNWQFGISVGAQIRRDTAPEDMFTSSSTYRPCNTIEGIDQSNNCAYDTDDNGDPIGASDTYFVSNQYIYRAMQTNADRDAVMTNLQWRNDNWDINVDLQYSERDDLELRHNLVIADGRRDIAPIEISPTGALLAWSGETRLENQSVWRNRVEDYIGSGLSVEWSNDNLTVTGDIGYSKTERRQDELDMRIRTNRRVFYDADRRGATVPNMTLTDVSAVENDTGLTFDLMNHDIYTNGARARRRLEAIDDEILSARLDFDFAVDWSGVNSFKTGLRVADRQRFHDDGMDTTLSLVSGYGDEDAIAARRDSFPVEDLFDGADTSMTGITWATWHPEQLWNALTGSRDAGLPTGSTLSTHDADVTEQSFALYGQADFETTLFGLPAFGNFGIRAVYSDIESLGVSTALETQPGTDPGTIVVVPVGEATVNTETNDFWNILPSVNLSLELDEDQLLRFALYSAIARPDQEAMSAALDFDDDGDDVTSIGEIVSASGNPMLEPLESTNFDVSFEWYASETTALSVAGYYKRLETGIETTLEDIVLIVDDTPTPVTIGRSTNSSKSSSLKGVELTVNHVFTGLPGAWSGLGVSAGYNYADSDFEFPDPTVVSGNALADFTEPANIPGYSEKSANLATFWENEWASVRLAYKYRSMYFKPFRTSANRYAESQDFLDFSARFKITKNIAARVQGLNLLDEPNIMNRPTTDSLAQADYSGRRVFLGIDVGF